jgi:three-Cys-motif partner protein
MKVDIIGEWSVDKLTILRLYAERYSLILNRQTYRGDRRFTHAYIDGFAGAGEHVAKSDGRHVPGSPLNALAVQPPFDEYHFVDMDAERVANLRHHARHHANASVHLGDCNHVLLKTVFPRYTYDSYARALCFLDPYGMTLDWQVIQAAGKLGTIEIFLNFPIMDINRNVKVPNPKEADITRFVRFWGDESGLGAFKRETGQGDLFGGTTHEKNDNDGVVEAFRERLQSVAGFSFVPPPVAMRNSVGAIVYYLFFAGPKESGSKIAAYIFNQYRKGRDKLRPNQPPA